MNRKPATVATLVASAVVALATMAACDRAPTKLSDEQIDNIVRRSYQYVAMYNVNNKFATKQGGWNTVDADTELKDHTMREIARPNNDTLYIGCMLDLRKEPVILEMPAFDSKYVSLMVTGYDHYVSVPLASRLGDFRKPERMLFYSARTEGYDGREIEGVDRVFEATGDFVSAVFRIMPHASEPDRFRRIVGQMESVRLLTLSEYEGGDAPPADAIEFPAVGATDADVFGTNFPEVMQFVFNHTTFDPDYPADREALAALRLVGVEPGKEHTPGGSPAYDGPRFRASAERIQREWLTKLSDGDLFTKLQARIFQPKNETDLEAVLAVSIIGPIGLPQEEAVYPQVTTADGEPMNAQHDYVIRMSADELPPAGAFWSLTLYDLDQGFFLPNERKKYSVGENGGMKIDDKGGIEIHIAAKRPPGVPLENWLPIPREDLDLSPQLRVYVPDLERMDAWTPPKAERVPAS
jgi:hypothetical protein